MTEKEMHQILSKNIDNHRKLLDFFEKNCTQTVIDCAKTIVDSYRKKGTVYLCGNGGSACDCQHIAGELVGRFLKNRPALSASSFTADTSVLTCIGNDFDFDQVFAKQAEGLMTQNDVLWAFSCSGSSRNILNAVKIAKNKKAKIIAFTGKQGSQLEAESDVCLAIPATYAGPAQEIHMIAYHTICQLIEAEMFPDTPNHVQI